MIILQNMAAVKTAHAMPPPTYAHCTAIEKCALGQ